MRDNYIKEVFEQTRAMANPITKEDAAAQLAQRPRCADCGEALYEVCKAPDQCTDGEKQYYIGVRQCACERVAAEEAQRKRLAETARENARKKADYIKASGLPPRYQDLSFASLQRGHNKSFDVALTYCDAYCKNIRKALAEGLGVYLYGPAGVGKTTLTACMITDFANQVVETESAWDSGQYDSGRPLHLITSITTMADIARRVKATWRRSDETEDDIIRRICSVSVLFLDDFGTERMSAGADISFVQELTYQVINGRYGAKRPTIITSNYSLAQLRKEVGVMDKTVDRINEMCDGILQISGESFRKTLAANRAKLF